MNKESLYLVPEIVINLIDKFKACTNQNELFNLRIRLETTRDFINETLQGKQDKFFRKRS